MTSDQVAIVVCPLCQGCGRTSINANTGEVVPQPTFTSNNTSARGWDKCTLCDGYGALPVFKSLFGTPVLTT